MRKRSLLFIILTVMVVGGALTGCAGQKLDSASADSLTTPKVKQKNADSSRKNPTNTKVKIKAKAQRKAQNTPVETTAEAPKTQSSAANSGQVSNKAAQTTGQQEAVAAPVKQKEAPQPNSDFLLKQRLVNSAMGYIAYETGQGQLTGGYWNYAKQVWGVTDAQILTPLGNDSYQILSQGTTRYVLTIAATTATVVEHSDYDNTTVTITLDKNSAAVIAVE